MLQRKHSAEVSQEDNTAKAPMLGDPSAPAAGAEMLTKAVGMLVGKVGLETAGDMLRRAVAANGLNTDVFAIAADVAADEPAALALPLNVRFLFFP